MDIKSILDDYYHKYNRTAFIESDPVSVPHKFISKENIEIAGFLTATIAWGKRAMILRSANQLMQLLDNDPYGFICDASDSDYNHLQAFVHRTFNGIDLVYFIKSLKNIYMHHGGLEQVFTHGFKGDGSIKGALEYFHTIFFETNYPQRTIKHIANVGRGSSAKRLNMFLRWMVRSDNNGVDFGVWKQIPASALYLPLDVHTGNISRELGLLQRKPNDWKAVEEVTRALREFDPADPVKYDFALFGMGVFEKGII